jgi:hypothetical protein
MKGAEEDRGTDNFRGYVRNVLSSPAVLYTAIWLFTYLLLELRWLTFLEPVNSATRVLVGSTVIAGLLIDFGFRSMRRSSTPLPKKFLDSARLKVSRDRILLIAAVGSAIETMLFPGLPLIYVLVGNTSQSYADFGFPTIHGLLTALFLVSASITALLFLDRPSWRTGWPVLLHLTWPILMLNRGALAWVMLEFLCLYLIRRAPSLRNLAWISLSVGAAVLLFGFLGDIRLGVNSRFFEALISEGAPGWFRDGPSGLVWVYTYLATALNNLNTAVAIVEPSSTLYWSVVNLFPSVVRTIIYDDFIPRYALPLAIDAFNTSTFYATFWRDFGFAGAFAAFGMTMSVATVFHEGARRGSIPAILSYAVMGRVILLSIFWDTATSLVTLFQLVVIVAISYLVFERSDTATHST